MEIRVDDGPYTDVPGPKWDLSGMIASGITASSCFPVGLILSAALRIARSGLGVDFSSCEIPVQYRKWPDVVFNCAKKSYAVSIWMLD